MTALIILAIYIAIVVTCIAVMQTHTDRRLNYIMAELDDINTALDSISTDVDATLEHVTELETEITTLQGEENPDLSGVLTKVQAIKAKLEGVATTVDGATPSA